MSRAHSCPACDAKDQTILMLADQVDWLRSQLPGATPAAHQPVDVDAPPAEWFKDEEEDIIAMLENGSMTSENAEAALAAIQAQHQTLTVVK